MRLFKSANTIKHIKPYLILKNMTKDNMKITDF